MYRFSLAGRRRDMGLGAFPAVSLALARKLAADARAVVKAMTPLPSVPLIGLASVLSRPVA